MIDWILWLIGLGVVLWYGGYFVVDVLRCAYWAVWETVAIYPHARLDEKITTWHWCKHIWFRFVDHWTETWVYDSRAVNGVYSHGYWPWDPAQKWKPHE